MAYQSRVHHTCGLVLELESEEDKQQNISNSGNSCTSSLSPQIYNHSIGFSRTWRINQRLTTAMIKNWIFIKLFTSERDLRAYCIWSRWWLCGSTIYTHTHTRYALEPCGKQHGTPLTRMHPPCPNTVSTEHQYTPLLWASHRGSSPQTQAPWSHTSLSPSLEPVPSPRATAQHNGPFVKQH